LKKANVKKRICLLAGALFYFNKYSRRNSSAHLRQVFINYRSADMVEYERVGGFDHTGKGQGKT